MLLHKQHRLLDLADMVHCTYKQRDRFHRQVRHVDMTTLSPAPPDGFRERLAIGQTEGEVGVRSPLQKSSLDRCHFAPAVLSAE